MRRAIDYNYDYRQWVGTHQSETRELKFYTDDGKSPLDLHTTHPTIYWRNPIATPKIQFKDSDSIFHIWKNLEKYLSDNKTINCADWLNCVHTSAWGSTELKHHHSKGKIVSKDRKMFEVYPYEKMKITVYSDENDFDGEQPYFKRSLLSFMVLHNDGKNVILTPLINGTTKFPFENKVEEVNYPHAEDVFVSRLCSVKSKKHEWVNELFVVNIDSINGQPENSKGGSVFDDELKFGDFIHSSWDFNTNKEGITEIGEAILGDNLVYDLIPKTDLYVGGNLIEKMLRLTNDNYNKYAMLDLMNELTQQAERVIDTHTVSTTTKVKTSKTTFIPSWKDNRPTQIIDLTDGEYVMYSDIIRCPVCNVKVKVIGKGSNRKSQAECPLCKKGKIEFPHLVNEEGVEEE